MLPNHHTERYIHMQAVGARRIVRLGAAAVVIAGTLLGTAVSSPSA
jgi:hypothetical protein